MKCREYGPGCLQVKDLSDNCLHFSAVPLNDKIYESCVSDPRSKHFYFGHKDKIERET